RRAGDLAVDLVDQVVQLAPGPAQGGGLVAEDALGRALDALAQLAEALAGVPGRLGRFLGDPRVDELPGLFQGLGDRLFGRLAGRVEEPPGQERLGLLGLLDRLAHPVEDLVELSPLLFQALADLPAVPGVAERALGLPVPGVELFGELALVLVETP